MEHLHPTLSTEFEFIEQLRRRCVVRPPVTVGIGDDAAVLEYPSAVTQVITTDLLMEGVDFVCESATPELMGRKSLAVNLSDLAAMGAWPTAVFVSVCLPRQYGRAFAARFQSGLQQLADEYEVTIAGGDTNSWDGPLVCSITAVGKPLGAKPVLRSGAQPGDRLLVTGACGGSLAGRHLFFTPRLKEVARLLELVPVRALIDISDGLSADLHHLLKSSGVGAIVDAAAIPIHPDVEALPAEKTPLQRALSDGEDFELLLTVSPTDAERLARDWDLSTPLTPIGTITGEPGCWLRGDDGRCQPLPPQGWSHDLGPALDGPTTTTPAAVEDQLSEGI